jgi:hypothetical protein
MRRAALHVGVQAEIAARLSSASRIDAVADYARPIATSTAIALFGLRHVPPEDIAAMTRVLFQYTFLDIPSCRAMARSGWRRCETSCGPWAAAIISWPAAACCGFSASRPSRDGVG